MQPTYQFSLERWSSPPSHVLQNQPASLAYGYPHPQYRFVSMSEIRRFPRVTRILGITAFVVPALAAG
ncbi:MAG TPA: hypothetical protein VF190_00415, partial [Rhodothermales bacterium]